MEYKIHLVRWYISLVSLIVPQAAGPVLYSLFSLTLTGTTKNGALIIFIITAAQILGVLPLSFIGKLFDDSFFLSCLFFFD